MYNFFLWKHKYNLFFVELLYLLHLSLWEHYYLKQTKKSCFIMMHSSELSKYHTLEFLQHNRKLVSGKKHNNKHVILPQCKDFSNCDLHPGDFIMQCDVNCMKNI